MPTGHCLVLVTPDAERTMHTVLRRRRHRQRGFGRGPFGPHRLVFCRGLYLGQPERQTGFLHAAETVRANGGKVAFSLADGFCVERHHADFMALLGSHIDIVLANETEITALFGTAEAAALVEKFAAFDVLAAVTHGADGVDVFEAGGTQHIEALQIDDVVDLTGAGDQFAAGFLSALHKGQPPEKAAAIGVVAATEVIRHVGPIF